MSPRFRTGITSALAGLVLAGTLTGAVAPPASAAPTAACPASAVHTLLENPSALIYLADAQGRVPSSITGFEPSVLGHDIIEDSVSSLAPGYDVDRLAEFYANWLAEPANQASYGKSWALFHLNNEGESWADNLSEAQDRLGGAGCKVALSGTDPDASLEQIVPIFDYAVMYDGGRHKVALELSTWGSGYTGKVKVTIYRWHGSSIGSYRKAVCNELRWKDGAAKRAEKVLSKTVKVTNRAVNGVQTITFKTPRRGCMIAVVSTAGEQKTTDGVRIK